jgi:hypothetical protein
MAADPYALTPPKGIIEAKPVIANTSIWVCCHLFLGIVW